LNQIIQTLLLLACTILVSACGQYGDLYHPPEQQSSEQATAEQQAETGEAEDKEKQ
jgi:predicted small lipoprotein YifL